MLRGVWNNQPGAASRVPRGEGGEKLGDYTIIQVAWGPRFRGQQNKKESLDVTELVVEQ